MIKYLLVVGWIWVFSINNFCHAYQSTETIEHDNPEGNTEVIDIPFDTHGSQIIINDIWVNGTGPKRFKFDTGAQGDGRIDKELTHSLKLSASGTVQAGDSSGRTGRELSVYQIESLRVGDIAFNNLELISRDYNSAREVDARGRLDGMLGIGIFSEYLIRIDYSKKVLTISKGHLSDPDNKRVFQMEPEEPVPTVPIMIAGKAHSAYVDSGAMPNITISEPMSSELLFVEPPKVVGRGSSVLGEFDISMAQLAGDISVGETSITNPQVFIAESFERVILGAPFLSQFVIAIDQKNKLIEFVKIPASNAAKSEPRRRYGMMMTPPKSGQNSIPILGVIEGSIAEEQGLQKEDLITMINKQKIAGLKPDDIISALRSPVINLTYMRNGSSYQLTLQWDE